MSNNIEDLKRELKALDSKKQQLEKDMKAAVELLEASPVGLHGRLVDAEGFPRDDCDLYAIRGARNTLACGKTDLESMENEMHEKLRLLHELTKDLPRQPVKTQNAQQSPSTPPVKCFVRVDQVASNSPAADCGLVVGDEIVSFGSIYASNFSGNLLDIADLAKQNENMPLPLSVIRAGSKSTLSLFLVCRKWDGNGLIGCVMTVMDS